MKKYIIVCIFSVILFVTGCRNSKEENNEQQKNNPKKETVESVKYNDCAKAGKVCSEEDIYKGALVNVKVNEKESYDFYVLSDDGKYVTLFMNGNLGQPIPWLSGEDLAELSNGSNDGSNSYGPYTALKYLNNLTSKWQNIENISSYNYNYDKYSDHHAYQSISITNGTATIKTYDGNLINVPGSARARLLTQEEITTLKEHDAVWVYKKLREIAKEKKDSMKFDDSVSYSYYWTLSASYSQGAATALQVLPDYEHYHKLNQINNYSTLLVFPVIVVNKDQI